MPDWDFKPRILGQANKRAKHAHEMKSAGKAIMTNPAKQSYHHGDLSAALVTAARELLEESGYASLSLRAAARRVGVSQTAPSHHFGDKDGLLAAVATDGFRELLSARQMILENTRDPRERVRDMMLGYIAFARKHPGLFGIMLGKKPLDRRVYTELRVATLASYQLFNETVEDFARRSGWPEDWIVFVGKSAWALEHGIAELLIAGQIPLPIEMLNTEAWLMDAIETFIVGIERRFA